MRLLECLENRALLTAVLENGVLTVTGTAGDDVISIVKRGDGTKIGVLESVRNVVAPPAPSAAGEARGRHGRHGNSERGGTPPTVTEFDLASVTSIVVNAGDGNDAVSIGGKHRRTTLTISATFNGDAGNDLLIGGAAADQLNGGEGNDRLDGRAGDDLLKGGNGADRIEGGLGNDSMYGEAGNDRIYAADRGGVDLVDGGENDTPTVELPGDFAVLDSADTASAIEKQILRGVLPST